MRLDTIEAGAEVGSFVWLGNEEIDEIGDTARAVIGPPNFMHIWWLEKALTAARSVTRIRRLGGAATGFVIAPDILMTNNHVFKNAEDASLARLEFNYRFDGEDNFLSPLDIWECEPEVLFKTNPALDYSIVKVKQKNGKNVSDVWGMLNLRHGKTVDIDHRINIIQHPKGQVQQIAFRDNLVKAIRPTFVQYLTDTEKGSSGSPVFDDNFNVVALHNQAVPQPHFPDRWYRNQGYRIEAILDDIGNLIS